MRAPMLIFALVFVVIVWQLISGAKAGGSPTIPVWMVVVGSVGLLVSMVGGGILLVSRNRREPPRDTQDHEP